MGKISFCPSKGLAVGLLWGLMALSACGPPAEDIDLIPADRAPGIAVITPSSTRLFQEAGEEGTVTLRLADNEQLALLRIIPQIYDQRDSLVQTEAAIDIPIEGQTQDYVYPYTVPNLDPYFKVRYLCYAIDLAGQSDQTSFWVSVMPPPSDPPPFQTLTYERDTLFNRLSGSQYAFNLSARRRLPAPGEDPAPLTLQMDIAESSGSGQSFWQPSLSSPNNARRGNDSSVFVIVEAEQFNYEAANYNTLYRAFFADPAPAATAPPTEHPIADRNKAGLEVGDLVIVRLIKTPAPQFAVLRIEELVDDGAGVNVSDLVIFDYKVTSP